MPRGLQINYEDVWKEVSMAEFQNINPSTQYDKESIKQWPNYIEMHKIS